MSFNCRLKPSELNNECRALMARIKTRANDLSINQTDVFRQTFPYPLGMIVYAEKPLSATWWQLCDGAPAKGQLAAIMAHVPKLIEAGADKNIPVFIAGGQESNLRLQQSTNKKHSHAITIGEANPTIDEYKLWRWDWAKGGKFGYYPFNPPRPDWIEYKSQKIYGEEPHDHDIEVSSTGGDAFYPKYIKALPFICYNDAPTV